MYLGLDLDWYYSHRKLHFSIMPYVIDALTRSQHNNPQNLQHQPYPHIRPNYGAKSQYAEAVDVSPTLYTANEICVQEVRGDFLYHAQAVDPTTMTAVGSIESHQTIPMEHTMKKVKQLLKDEATYPDAILTYHASDMVLAGHSDASYLSEKNLEA